MLLLPRLDPKIWGGRALEKFGFALPPEGVIGEAVLTAPESLVADGEFAGQTLGSLIALDPELALGRRSLEITRGKPIFPMLIKLIDAHDDLSIQVHPRDEHVLSESLGKTEAWLVLSAEPGSVLYCGLRPGISRAELDS